MKIVLIAPNTRSKNEIKDIPLITQPINLMYIAQSLIDESYDPKIIDAYLENLTEEEILNRCRRINPDLVLISLYSNDLNVTFSLTNKIKKDLPNCKIILGGHHATHLPFETLKEFKNADIILKGEGELSIKHLVKAIEKKKSLKNLNSITFKDGKKIVNTHFSCIIEDIDKITIPERRLVEKGRYYSKMFSKNPLDVIITSRGCPYQCIFCAKLSEGFKRYRVRSADNVFEEIKMIHDNGAKSLEIYDETFTIDKKRCYEILDMMKKNKIDMEFRVRTRVNVIDKTILEKLKKSGCTIICYGVESGNQNVLNINKKGTTLKMVEDAFKLTHKIDIATMGFFLICLKGDTPQTIQDTINFAKKLNPHYTTFGHVLPYPGTEFYNSAKKEGTLVGDWGVNKPMPYVKLPWLKSKQQALDMVADAYKQFYYRPNYALTYMWRLLKRHNFNQISYSIKNMFSDLRQVNSVVVDEHVG